MCDYSLDKVASRPAQVGDKLVTTEFCASFTRGFSAEGQPNVAVCLLPGTEVAFEQNVVCETDRMFGIGWFKKEELAHKVARFRHIKPEDPHVHHDALEFPNGKILLLTQLKAGQHATVLQLPAASSEPVVEAAALSDSEEVLAFAPELGAAV